MTTESPTENLLAHVAPNHRTHRRVAKWIGRIVLVLGLVGFGLGAAAASTPRQKGIFLLLLVTWLFGFAIAWLSAASNRLSSSGRELGDYWRTRFGQRW